MSSYHRILELADVMFPPINIGKLDFEGDDETAEDRNRRRSTAVSIIEPADEAFNSFQYWKVRGRTKLELVFYLCMMEQHWTLCVCIA